MNQTRRRSLDRALEAVQYLLWFAATEMGFDNSSAFPNGDEIIGERRGDEGVAREAAVVDDEERERERVDMSFLVVVLT